ncbi:MAG TPA: hypothetical protein VGF47_09685 [Solirubrobacteraceae bacterium]|jgi:hypothetical protein
MRHSMGAEDRSLQTRASSQTSVCVAQYLYVHRQGDSYRYPSARSSGTVAQLAARYLECALVQAASLRVNAPSCRLALVTNVREGDSLSGRGRALLECLERLGVELVHADYRHAPRAETPHFHSSRYVLDAIEAIVPRLSDGEQLWLLDLDCVWVDPAAAFAALQPGEGIGALAIGYPEGWEVSGRTREELGAIGARLGACDPLPHWIGGELLAGTGAQLLEVLHECERLEAELAQIDVELATEEHLLTVAGGLGRLRFTDLAGTIGRIWTGHRHEASNPSDPAALAVWHLPSEKGLSLRRAANALLSGRDRRLLRDLADRERAARRFSVAGAGYARRLRDDGWIASSRVRDTIARKLAALFG